MIRRWVSTSHVQQISSTTHALLLHYPGPGLSYLFLRHAPISFSTVVYGYYIGTTMAVKSVCLLIFLPLARRLFNITSTEVMIVSLLSAIAGNSLLGASRNQWMVFLCERCRCFVK